MAESGFRCLQTTDAKLSFVRFIKGKIKVIT